MKIQQFTLYFLALLFIVLQSTSCKDDDDNDSGKYQPIVETFQNSCCRVPPQNACVGGGKVYIPNAFTPNGDGANDRFFIFGDQGIQYVSSARIFNKDNIVVFESNEFRVNVPSDGWDGRQSGNAPEDGLFNYEITVSDLNGVTEVLTGQVCCRASSQPMPCVYLENQCAYSLQHDGAGKFEETFSTGENCE